ncbi:hypothetical protein V8F20_007862 [Naviculisporaceae sp. PSN 640]
MKTSQHACIALLMGLLPLALGQGSLTTASLGPSPTQSVGCEPHGDHWDCEGPRVTSGAATPSTLLISRTTAPPSAITSSPADPDHDHDHDDDHSEEDHDDHDDDVPHTGSLKPSPTESVGCTVHGDHWHCDAPATASPTQSTSTTAVPTGASTVGSGGSHNAAALLSVLGAGALGIALAL